MNITRFFGLAPILMNEAGGEGGSGGGGESTALATTTGTAIVDSGDGSGGDLTTTGDGGVTGTTAADSEPVFDASGRMTQTTSKAFKGLATSNPTLRAVLGKAERALGAWGKLTAMLGPKPFDRLNELRKFEKEVGGADGLKVLRETVADMEKSDSLYEKADPQLIAMMTETPAAKHAFVKLFPHSVAKMRELSPMGYTQWLGSQLLNSIEKAVISVKSQNGDVVAKEEIDIPRRLRRIVGAIPWTQENGRFTGGSITALQVQELQADLSFLFAYVDQVRAYADATPEDLTPPKEDRSAARIAEAERATDEAIQKSWVIQRNSAINNFISSEVRKQTKDMQLSSTITLSIEAAVRESFNAYRKSRPDQHRKCQAFLESKNEAGYLAYFKNLIEDHAPEAVTSEVEKYSRKSYRRAATAKTETTVTQGAQQTSSSGQQQAGKVVMLTAQQAQDLGGRASTRYVKPDFPGNPGTTMAMVRNGQQMLRKNNPLGLPEGTIVQFPK